MPKSVMFRDDLKHTSQANLISVILQKRKRGPHAGIPLNRKIHGELKELANFQEVGACLLQKQTEGEAKGEEQREIAQSQILTVFSPFVDDTVTWWVWPLVFSSINWLLPFCSKQILRQTISYVKYTEKTFIESR